VNGAVQHIHARRRIVDATYMNVQVPSMRPSPWPVAESERCVPLNALAQLTEPADHYTVIGAGKTGIDACLWLLGESSIAQLINDGVDLHNRLSLLFLARKGITLTNDQFEELRNSELKYRTIFENTGAATITSTSLLD
jgi:PAS domain-containing protein